MLTTFALLAAAVITSSTSLSLDPSLSALAVTGAPTPAPSSSSTQISSSGEVLNSSGILLTWDDKDKVFALSLDGKSVDDLVTTNTSFAGGWSGNNATIYGNVTSASNDKWTVDITRPSHKPQRFSVVAAGDYSEVTAIKTCDCADGIGLTCKTTDCDAGNSCSAGTSTCKWKTSTPGGTSR